MQNRIRPSRRADARRLALGAALTALIAVGAACGSDGETASVPEPEAGSPAARGLDLSRSNGCAGCHGADFGGGAGPTWVGIVGTEAQLVDGSAVVRDEAYLTRSIADPNAEIVDGYTLRMPANNLSDDEVADIVAFIETLAADG